MKDCIDAGTNGIDACLPGGKNRCRDLDLEAGKAPRLCSLMMMNDDLACSANVKW